MDKLLLHCCCGPCSMYPISFLKSKNTELDMFWFNPNIHPEFEWKRRLDNLRIVASYYNEELIESCHRNVYHETGPDSTKDNLEYRVFFGDDSERILLVNKAAVTIQIKK